MNSSLSQPQLTEILAAQAVQVLWMVNPHILWVQLLVLFMQVGHAGLPSRWVLGDVRGDPRGHC
jgi:hypothetical protein